MGQRPVATGESTQHVTFRANDSLVADLHDYLDRSGAKKADVLRAAVRQFLEQEVAAS